jgi:biopolymer transport protein ExbB
MIRTMLKLIALALLLAVPALAQTVPDPPAPAAVAPTPDVPTPAGEASTVGPLAPSAEEAAPALLPHDLSPWSMFVTADHLVQAVMVGLALASLVTWAIWLAKTLQLRAARRRAEASAVVLAEAASLAEASLRLSGLRGAGPALVRAAEQELEASADIPSGGIQERVASRLERGEAAAERHGRARHDRLDGPLRRPVRHGLGHHERVRRHRRGAHHQSRRGGTGIAEALLATALGLVAAIPAVVFHNGFARGLQGYRASLRDTGAAIERLVGRDLDRARLHRLRPAA